VVKINPARVADWTDQEVAQRWLQIFSGPLLMRQFLTGTDLTECQIQRVAELLAIWRERLADLSWLMRCINEPIARMANSEDHCTGSFWEGRFKSQALLDDRALLACMAYVDLSIGQINTILPEPQKYQTVIKSSQSIQMAYIAANFARSERNNSRLQPCFWPNL
jgi:hypothetical protein